MEDSAGQKAELLARFHLHTSQMDEMALSQAIDEAREAGFDQSDSKFREEVMEAENDLIKMTSILSSSPEKEQD